MKRRLSVGRRPSLIALAAALLLSACGAGAPGTAVTQPWTPLPDTLTATLVSDETSLIAVSPDLTTAVREQDGHPACWVERTSPDDPGVCADVPDEAGRMSATFSPDGSRYTLVVDPAGSAKPDGPWIVEASTGKVTPVDLSTAGGPAGPTIEPPSSTASSSAASSATTASGTPSIRRPVVADLRWNGNDRLIGLTLDRVLRVDAGTGTGEVIAALPALERPTLPSMAIGGSTLAVLLGTTLSRVDLATGSLTALSVRLGDEGGRAVLMGVSPDGARALVSTTDVTRSVAGPVSIVGLADSSLTEIPGTGSGFHLAGGFSPDGARVVLVAAAPQDSESSGDDPDSPAGLLLAPADASANPVLIGPSDPAPYGALVWSRTNVVSSTAMYGQGLRVWQLAG